MNTRLAGAVFLSAFFAVVVSGCGGSEEGSGGEEGGGPSGEFVIYTSEPQENADELVAAFEEEYPGVEPEVFRSGTGSLVTRIQSEVEAGELAADVLYVADAPTFEMFKEDDLFSRYTPEGTDRIDERFKDPDGYYTGTRLIGTMIGYNTDEVEGPPESWQDLTDSKYQSRLGMPSPDYSGSAAYNTALWASQEELGWEWIEALVANEPSVVDGNGEVQQGLATGRYSAGIVLDYMVRELEDQGSPVSGVYPEEGVPVITRPVGIFESSDNKEAAEAFADFLISDEGQEIGVEQNYIPLVPGIEPLEGTPSLEEVDVMEGDLDELTTEQDAAAERFGELLESGG